MANWTTIHNSDVDALSPVSWYLIQALEANLRALAEKGAGAPYIGAAALDPANIHGDKIAANTLQGSKIAANAITQADLLGGGGTAGAVGQSEVANIIPAVSATTTTYNPPTSYGTAFSIGNGAFFLGYDQYVSATGQYLFQIGYYPFTQTAMVAAGSLYSLLTWVWIGVDPMNIGTAYLSFYFISASPPYQMGKTDVPLFIFADVAPNGTIICAQLAADPPWNRGVLQHPRMRYGKDGKTYYQPRPEPPAEWGDPQAREAYLVALSGPREEVELTPEIKNERMADRPHPFGAVLGAPVMLDPGASIVRDLYEYAAADEGAARECLQLVMEGDVLLGDEIDGLDGPPGVSIRRARLR